jgi:hypothetical protein
VVGLSSWVLYVCVYTPPTLHATSSTIITVFFCTHTCEGELVGVDT